jgi:hypothetical protein
MCTIRVARLRDTEAIVLPRCEFLAQMIMASASLLGGLLNGRFECAFKGSSKRILARSIPLDVKHEVLWSVKFDLLETNLGICKGSRTKNFLVLLSEKDLDAVVKKFQVSR